MMKKLVALVLICTSVAQAQVSNSTVTVKQSDPTKLQSTVTGTVNVGTSTLPTGAATSALQNTGNASLASLDGKTTTVDTGNVTISAALPAGANNIGDVDVVSSALPAGAATETTLALIDGKIVVVDTGNVTVASSSLPTGAATSALQTTGNASLTSLDGKITVVDTGNVTISSALPTGTNNIGDVDIASSALPTGAATEATLALINGKIVVVDTGNVTVVGSALPTGASTSALQTTGNASLASLDAKTTVVNTGAVTISTALPAGTNNIGDVDVLAVIPGTGATNLGKQQDVVQSSVNDTGVASLFLRNSGVPADVTTGNLRYSTASVDSAGRVLIGGQVPNDSPSAGSPVGIGGVARSTGEPTAVASGDAIFLMTDLLGKLINFPYAPGLKGQRGRTGAFNSSAAQTMFAAGGAGIHYYLTSCIFGNAGVVSAAMILSDGAPLIYADVIVPAGSSVAMEFPYPIRTADNVDVTCAGPALASLYCSCYGFPSAS